MRFRSLLGHRPGLLVLPVRPPSYFSCYNSGEGGSSERSDICYILQRAKQYNYATTLSFGGKVCCSLVRNEFKPHMAGPCFVSSVGCVLFVDAVLLR